MQILKKFFRNNYIGWFDVQTIQRVQKPLWIGLAQRDYPRDRALLLPIPLNFVWAVFYDVFVFIRAPRPNWNDDRPLSLFIGFAVGFTAGIYIWRVFI